MRPQRRAQVAYRAPLPLARAGLPNGLRGARGGVRGTRRGGKRSRRFITTGLRGGRGGRGRRPRGRCRRRCLQHEGTQLGHTLVNLGSPSWSPLIEPQEGG
jgi:hypothetical protein